MKKMLAVIIAVVLVFSIIPLNCFAEEKYSGTCGDSLTWTLDFKTGELIIRGEGEMWDFDWSDAPWYHNSPAIETIFIDNNVTSIGNYAFFECHNLRNITIPSSVKSFGIGAFYCCCRLNHITIPQNLISIGYEAFEYCDSLKSVYYTSTPDNWSKINIADSNNNLTNAKIRFATEIQTGDINGDGKINSLDALMCLQSSVKKIELFDIQFELGDVNGDNKVNSYDALKILQFSVGN